jgi:hypothetical protein
MVHVPVNHPLQPLYRLLAGLIGAYLTAFGVVGVMRTGGRGLFAQDGLPSALGLHANRAFAILSIVVGLVLLVGAIIGRNVDQRINLVASVVFLGSGLLMLLLINTEANFLGFTLATCVVSFLIGMALLVCGLYGKVRSPEFQRAEDEFRHQRGPDPERHRLHGPNPPYQHVEEARDQQPRKRSRANVPGGS